MIVKYNKDLGFFSYKLKWAPSITYLHRRFLILSKIDKLKLCKNILEIGSGSGSILAEINKKCPSVNTYAYEKSLKAINIIKKFSPSTKIIKNLDKKKYDAVIFFEVMEHIKNDKLFLKKIYKILKKNGLIILSVPAHMEKWSVADIWAGHYRRYEKKDLKKFITMNNFRIESFYSYGFPFCNFVQFVSKYIKKKKIKFKQNQNILNKESGIDRGPELAIFRLLKIPLISPILKVVLYFQVLFFRYDFGIGYFVVANKCKNRR